MNVQTEEMKIVLINKNSGPDGQFTNQKIADFLYEHLDEFGDEKEDILKCLDYVFNPYRGGNILVAAEDGAICGAVILNDTGMNGYIPENILVYIAVHKNYRGKGYGKRLMENAIRLCPGNIALHVEPNNPAKILYEKLGFTNKYLEMRLTRTK